MEHPRTTSKLCLCRECVERQPGGRHISVKLHRKHQLEEERCRALQDALRERRQGGSADTENLNERDEGGFAGDDVNTEYMSRIDNADDSDPCNTENAPEFKMPPEIVNRDALYSPNTSIRETECLVSHHGSSNHHPTKCDADSFFSIHQEVLCRARHHENPTKLIFDDGSVYGTPTLRRAPRVDDNECFLDYEGWLQDLSKRTHTLLPVDSAAQSAKEETLRIITDQLDFLERVKNTHWDWMQSELRISRLRADRARSSGFPTFNTEPFFETIHMRAPPLMLACLFLIAALKLLVGVSTATTDIVLEALHVIVKLAFMFRGRSSTTESLTVHQHELLRRLPKTTTTALSQFNIEPMVHCIPSCPKCRASYDAEPDVGAIKGENITMFKHPPRCTSRETSLSPMCGQQLDAPSKRKFLLPKMFVHYPLLPWLASMLARPNMEKLMDQAWDLPTRHQNSTHDIWDAPAARDLRWSNGMPFSERPNGEGHYIFAMCIDWMNPNFNKAAGKSASVGLILLECLNIPLHLRSQMPNVYLAGVIPGPKEPSVTQLNQYLRFVVKDFEELWKGVFFTQTSCYPFGRIVRCALLPLICDLPALRKTAGFASATASNFCSFCKLTLNEIHLLDEERWAKRTAADHRFWAYKWHLASLPEREKIFQSQGVRWSELLRLPYWDPIRYSVVDAMHNLFLGVAKTHCRDIWAMDILSDEKKKKLEPHSEAKQKTELLALKVIISGNVFSDSAFSRFRLAYIRAVVAVNDLSASVGGKFKRNYVAALRSWRAQFPLAEIHLPVVPQGGSSELDGTRDEAKDRPSVLGASVLQELHRDMQLTSLPHWIESPPRNLGSASHGKLKADHWRTACTVSLPITLIRLWGQEGSEEDKRPMLKNFIHLAIALKLATRRSQTEENIKEYNRHMKDYVDGIVSLYGRNVLKPNHHLARHLSSGLRDFGPVHAWWSFPYERIIGKVQRMNTNKHMNELPLTFMRSFTRSSNLLGLLDRQDVPEALESLKHAFRNFMKFSGVNSLLESFPSRPEQNLSDSVACSINPSKVRKLDDSLIAGVSALLSEVDEGLPPYVSSYSVEYRNSLQMHGVNYSCHQRSAKNSFIMFSLSGGGSAAGQIQSIFLLGRRKEGDPVIDVFMEVQRFPELSKEDQIYDPFRVFTPLDMRLCYAVSYESLVIRSSSVVSHFASCPVDIKKIRTPHILVVSLNRA